jgi:hypothetical protein
VDNVEKTLFIMEAIQAILGPNVAQPIKFSELIDGTVSHESLEKTIMMLFIRRPFMTPHQKES